MTNLWLHVRMPDHSVWAIPAEIVAKERAAYYAENDTGKTSGPEYQTVYDEEVAFALSADGHSELFDYAANDMDWDDVKHQAKQVEPPSPVDYDSGWVSGSKWVAEWEGDTTNADA